MANLDMLATQYAWVCSECKTMFDVLWRPTLKGWRPPDAYMWTADKPSFKYCPECGASFEKGDSCGTETCEL